MSAALDANAFYAFLRKQEGKPYDFMGLIGAFITRREWDKPDKWWCSELQAAALMHIGLVNPLCTEADKISPRDLLLMIAGVQQNRVRLFERIGHGAAYLKTLTLNGD
jgi:hypothetical protein